MQQFSKLIVSLKQELDLLEQGARKAGAPGLTSRAEALRQRYFYMLRYYLDHANADIAAELAALRHDTDVLRAELTREKEIAGNSSAYYGLLRFERMRPDDTLEKLYTDYLAENDRLHKDTAAFTDATSRSRLETIAEDIFNRILTSFYLDDDRAMLVESMLIDDTIAEHDRRMWLAALGLGFLYVPDTRRLEILHSVMETGSDPMSAEAMAWIFNAPRQSDADDRARELIRRTAGAYPELYLEFLTHTLRTETGRTLAESRKFAQLTSRISPEITQKLSSLKSFDELDPEELARMTGFNHELMDQLTAMRKGTVDMMLAAFGTMRRQPFFNRIHNWFLPFHTGNSNLAALVDGDGVALAELMAHTPTTCSPDKYAVLLRLENVPGDMRRSLLENSATMFGGMIDLIDRFEKSLAGEESSRRLAALREWLAVYDRVRLYLDTLLQPEFSFAGFEPDTGNEATPELLDFAHALALSPFAVASLPFLTKVVESGGIDNKFALYVAKLLIKQGRDDEATRILREHTADSAYADVLLARIAFGRQDYDEALALLLRSDFREPLKGADRLLLLKVYMKQHDWEAAAAMKDLDCGIPDAPVLHSIALWQAGRRKEAVTSVLMRKDAVTNTEKLSATLADGGFSPEEFDIIPFVDAVAFASDDLGLVR